MPGHVLAFKNDTSSISYFFILDDSEMSYFIFKKFLMFILFIDFDSVTQQVRCGVISSVAQVDYRTETDEHRCLSNFAYTL